MEVLVHFFGISFIFGLLLALWFKTQARTKSICIVVLGDIGRSPRMQYHALSFVKEGFSVELIGYSGSQPLQELINHECIKIHHLHCPLKINNNFPRFISYAMKIFWQSMDLFYVLNYKCNSSIVFVQNPPAIPTIPICLLYCSYKKKRLFIDWHNYAHSIMALNLGDNHFIVKMAKFIESFFGSYAKYNFCVTKAMQLDLKNNWNIQAQVLYDRPPEEFHPVSLEEKHELLLKLSKNYEILKGDKVKSTIFTNENDDGQISLNPNRPGFIVSSTSWTPDEDFSILLDALDYYENTCKTSDTHFPDLICAITGKGPLKSFYKAIVEQKNWKHIRVIMPWLDNQDYPKLLGTADLGVCLHTSSSGLDLPMKIVDMFGCGLPVCAYSFKCLHELVKHNKNGLVFSNAPELTKYLKLWFLQFPHSEKQQKLKAQFQNEMSKFKTLHWHDNWTRELLPYFVFET